MKKLAGLIIAFGILLVFFWIVEFLWPAVKGQRRVRKGFVTDLFYWFFTPLISKSAAQLAVLIALVPVFLLLGRDLSREAVMAGYGPVLALPMWLQAVLLLFLGDIISYWTHRWFHGRSLWKFHAIHHSSEDLDWLSSVRLHPVNEIVTRVCQAVPFVALGFSPAVIAAYLPFLTFYAIFVHANVTIPFGPLKYVVASPDFHRWHHTAEEEGMNKNFAGLFPVVDMIFGTFHMPAGKRPEVFGIRNNTVPDTLLGQFMYPFRKASPPRGDAPDKIPASTKP